VVEWDLSRARSKCARLDVHRKGQCGFITVKQGDWYGHVPASVW
jgi:hypothetical protein